MVSTEADIWASLDSGSSGKDASILSEPAQPENSRIHARIAVNVLYSFFMSYSSLYFLALEAGLYLFLGGHHIRNFLTVPEQYIYFIC